MNAREKEEFELWCERQGVSPSEYLRARVLLRSGTLRPEEVKLINAERGE